MRAILGPHKRRDLLVLATLIAATSAARCGRADDPPRPAGNGDPLVVRDVSVFVLSAYGSKLNDRELFQTSLPGYTLSRRPTASRDEANTPIPLGIMTFSGPPQSDVDVLLEFEQGRILSHWPPGRLRSNRLLWAGLDIATETSVAAGSMPEGHWLSPLRQADRLFVAGSRASDRFLLYDAELPYVPHVTLQRAEEGEGYTVTNSGAFAVRDVIVYRPAGNDQWEVAAVAEVAAASKDQPQPPGEKAGSTPAADSPQPAQPQPAAAPAAPAEAPVAASPAAAAEAKVPAAPGQPAGAPEGQPAAAPAAAAPAGTSAAAPRVGTMNADEALQSWRESLAALQLESPEIDFVLSILRQQALRSDSAMLVYRLDEAHLEKLLPLEVTPYPDRLFRVGLVIVRDADPDLQSRVEALVAQLGHEEWKQREAAQQQLAALGLAAKPRLEAALKHEDAEIVFRAEQLLEALQPQPAP